MVRRTLKKNGRRRHTRKRGGATNKLPGIPKGMKLRDFLSKWDVFYIRAHGGLLPTQFKIPNNTYILHTVPSSIACTFPVNSEQLDIFYTEDRYSGFEGEFMDFIQDTRSVFPSVYKSVPMNTNVPDITSIYEPDDEVYDVSLSFASHTVKRENMARGGITHFIVPGIFKLPMSKSVKSQRDSIISNIRSKLRMPNERLQAALNERDEEFISAESNLLKGIIERNGGKKSYDLSKLISEPELQASPGKERFIIVHACKSIVGLPENESRNIIKRVRSESVNRIRKSNLARSFAKLSLQAAASGVAMGGPEVAIGGPGAAAPTGVLGKPVKEETLFGFSPGFILKKPPKKPASGSTSAAAGEGK